MNSKIFDEISTQLTSVIENSAGLTGPDTRRNGGSYLHGSRLASVAFWINALDADASAVNGAKLKIAALDKRLRQVATNAGLTVGADDLRAVLTLFGNSLSPEAQQWSMTVWNGSRPRDVTGLFTANLEREREIEALERTAIAIEEEERQRESAPARAAELRARAAQLRERVRA